MLSRLCFSLFHSPLKMIFSQLNSSINVENNLRSSFNCVSLACNACITSAPVFFGCKQFSSCSGAVKTEIKIVRLFVLEKEICSNSKYTFVHWSFPNATNSLKFAVSWTFFTFDFLVAVKRFAWVFFATKLILNHESELKFTLNLKFDYFFFNFT